MDTSLITLLEIKVRVKTAKKKGGVYENTKSQNRGSEAFNTS